MNRKQNAGFTLIELMIVVAIIGILAAIAIPNFVRFQARSKQSEVKANLKSWFTAEKTFYSEKDRYSINGALIGFAPEKNNRYKYWLNASCGTTWQRATGTELAPNTGTLDGAGGYDCIDNDSSKQGKPFGATMESTWGASQLSTMGGTAAPAAPGVAGECPSCNATAGAEGNIDNDAKRDAWYISTSDASGISGACGNSDNRAGAGEPYNQVNDVSC